MDATVTLLKRTARRVNVTEAHREHYDQRLVQMGWGHRNVAFAEYVLMLAAGISAIWGMRQPGATPWQLFVVWGAVYLVLMFAVDFRWRAYQRAQHGKA